MLFFTIAISVVCLILAMAGAVCGYLLVNDSGGGDLTSGLGAVVGMFVWTVSAGFGFVGIAGSVIVVKQIFG
jgi:hypothetical protein